MQQHVGDRQVVVELRLALVEHRAVPVSRIDLRRDDPLGRGSRGRRASAVAGRRRSAACGGQRDGDQARQDDQEREEHLGDGGDQRGAPGGIIESAAIARWITRKSVHQ